MGGNISALMCVCVGGGGCPHCVTLGHFSYIHLDTFQVSPTWCVPPWQTAALHPPLTCPLPPPAPLQLEIEMLALRSKGILKVELIQVGSRTVFLSGDTSRLFLIKSLSECIEPGMSQCIQIHVC